MRLVSVSGNGGYKARIQLDVLGKDGISARKELEINAGSKNDLYKLS